MGGCAWQQGGREMGIFESISEICIFIGLVLGPLGIFFLLMAYFFDSVLFSGAIMKRIEDFIKSGKQKKLLEARRLRLEAKKVRDIELLMEKLDRVEQKLDEGRLTSQIDSEASDVIEQAREELSSIVVEERTRR